jgi:hypothetical protein
MINKPGDVTKFDDSQVPILNAALDELFNNASGVKYTDTVPTASSVGQNEVVVYDDGAGTKRIYMITGKGNLGYITLT